MKDQAMEIMEESQMPGRPWYEPIRVSDRLPDTGIIMVWPKSREGYSDSWQKVFYDADDKQVSAEEWFGDIRKSCEFWMQMPPPPPAPQPPEE